MSVKKCTQCNLVNWATDTLCKRCGQNLQIIDVLQSAKVETSGAGFEQNQSPNHFQGEPVAQENHQFSSDFNQQPSSAFTNNFQTENRQVNSPQWNNQYSGYQTSHNNQRQNPRTKKGMAIASLILGVLGFPLFSIIIGGIVSLFLAIIFGTSGAIFGIAVFLLMIPLSLILGIVALSRAKKMPNEYGGKSLAITGIVFSSCGLLLLPVFGIIGAIAVPNVIEARKAANEGSAIQGLRMIVIAQETYRAENLRCADLKTLGAENMIDSRLVKGESNGYRYMVINLPTMNRNCAMTATPATTLDGVRAFYYSTEDGMIRARKYDGEPAGPTDEPIKVTEAPKDMPF